MKVSVNRKIKQLKLIERERPSSGLHKTAKDLLNKVYQGYKIYEEIYIPGTKLRFDFFIPRKLIAIEVQGQQHDKFIEHFHGQKIFFQKSRKRDEQKREFCCENGWTLVELAYNAIENWEDQLRANCK